MALAGEKRVTGLGVSWWGLAFKTACDLGCWLNLVV